MARVFNFCAGPAALPEVVLREAQADLVDYQGSGLSIMEASHRGPEYDAIHTEAIANLRTLLDLPEDYAVLLLHGGASGQFAMAPLNLLPVDGTADYVNSGAWASKAIKEAKAVGEVRVVADTAAERPARMPRPEEIKPTPGAAYLHVTSNETIAGTQMKTFPRCAAPLVADMSSDILARPLDVRPFGLIYAGAQKNLGPAGLAVAILRRDLAERARPGVPAFLRYATHLEANSLYNTPPCFAIYMLALTTRWLLRMGGVAAIERRNAEKAAKLYAAIDASGFYRGTAAVEDRSPMNVTFRLPDEALEKRFAAEADAAGLKQLKGHRSVGGLRASIYNAFPPEGVDALVDFMRAFERRNG